MAFHSPFCTRYLKVLSQYNLEISSILREESKKSSEKLLFGCTKKVLSLQSLLQFWVWHLNLIWLWLKFVLGVCFESIGRYLSEKKNGSWMQSFDSKYFLWQGRLTWKMLKKQPFCISELWTNKIHEFERSQNHFVPNVLSVKSFVYNLYMICLSDPPLCAFFLCKRNFLKKPKCFSIFR